MKVPVFGSRIEGRDYVLRPSAYALIAAERGDLALVRTPKGLYLPGGGIDDGESPEQAAARETAEECGLLVEITHSLGTADELVHTRSEGCFRKRSSFFRAVITGETTPIEEDHTLEWVSLHLACEMLQHGSHRWAASRLRSGQD